METESVLHWDRGKAGLYREEFPPLVPNQSILIQMRTPNLHSFIGSLVRMDHFWLISDDVNKDTAEDANENIDVQLWLNGKVSVQFVEIWFQELLYMDGLWRK